MNSPLNGIHHVTAIASDVQRNVDFYAGILGLRLVKKTVNFDDPSAYHLYYGDEAGTPGSIVTFFYWPGRAARGRIGVGQMTAITFSTAGSSLDFWRDRLGQNSVAVERRTRFGEEVLAFADPDGIPIEIVAVEHDDRSGWKSTDIPAAHALRGLLTAQLTVRNPQLTVDLLTSVMDYRVSRQDGSRVRLEVGVGGAGRYVDVIGDPNGAAGAGGSGTIHHVAWRVADDAAQTLMQERLRRAGFSVSPQRDRNYFRSIYYREHGGILFEIATDVPGFAVDEPPASLGTALKLPAQFEPHRAEIEAVLPEVLTVRPIK
jgi:glyoxalase family protein